MRNIILIFSISLLIFSCKKVSTETCSSGPIPYKSLHSEYGCSPAIDETNIGYATFVIIKNQTEYDNAISGGCQPNMDFDNFDLLIGRKQFASGIASITYNISKNCQDNTITVNGTVTGDDTLVAPEIIYSCLLPKLHENETVIVKFTIQ